jgi:hypothetical protein
VGIPSRHPAGRLAIVIVFIATIVASPGALAQSASPSPGSPAAATPANGFAVSAESPVTTVSLGLYSGRPDPSWELSEEESVALTALLESLPRVDGSPPSGGLGYHGFGIDLLTPEGMPRLLVAFEGTVSDPDSSHPSYLDDPARSVERFLLDSGRDRLSAAEVMAPGLVPAPAAGRSPLGGTWTAISVPGIAITDRLEAPGVQFRVDGHIMAATNCHEYLLQFALDGEHLSLGQLEVPATGDCTPRDQHIDTAFAAVLLSADTIVGGLPSDRLTISGPLGEIILAQPAAQSEWAAGSADA